MRTVLLLLVVGLLIAWYFYRQGLDRPEERQDRRISRSLCMQSSQRDYRKAIPGVGSTEHATSRLRRSQM